MRVRLWISEVIEGRAAIRKLCMFELYLLEEKGGYDFRVQKLRRIIMKINRISSCLLYRILVGFVRNVTINSKYQGNGGSIDRNFIFTRTAQVRTCTLFAEEILNEARREHFYNGQGNSVKCAKIWVWFVKSFIECKKSDDDKYNWRFINIFLYSCLPSGLHCTNKHINNHSNIQQQIS